MHLMVADQCISLPLLLTMVTSAKREPRWLPPE
jgi:hypothetical protein